MTKKESKQIDSILTWAVIASNRGVNKAKLLSAALWDVDLVRKGKEPEETKKLV